MLKYIAISRLLRQAHKNQRETEKSQSSLNGRNQAAANSGVAQRSNR